MSKSLTAEQKEAAKAAKLAEKEAAKAALGSEDDSDEIIVKDPQDLRPVALPLVITLPADASKAQIEFAKILNAYAYQNPTKWAIKKGKLIAQLKELKNAPDPIEEPVKSLKVGGSNKLAVA